LYKQQQSRVTTTHWAAQTGSSANSKNNYNNRIKTSMTRSSWFRLTSHKRQCLHPSCPKYALPLSMSFLNNSVKNKPTLNFQ